jgi:hypothetical protein
VVCVVECDAGTGGFEMELGSVWWELWRGWCRAAQVWDGHSGSALESSARAGDDIRMCGELDQLLASGRANHSASAWWARPCCSRHPAREGSTVALVDPCRRRLLSWRARIPGGAQSCWRWARGTRPRRRYCSTQQPCAEAGGSEQRAAARSVERHGATAVMTRWAGWAPSCHLISSRRLVEHRTAPT